jgi:hypothetical protein
VNPIALAGGEEEEGRVLKSVKNLGLDLKSSVAKLPIVKWATK